MRVVLDTNVLVSALLTPTGPAGEVWGLVFRGEWVTLYDERTLAEYREVLSRPKFKGRFLAGDIADMLEIITLRGEYVAAVPLANVTAPDPDDVPFLEVAVAGKADALVTGNAKDFPDTRGVELLSPRAAIERHRAG